MIPEPQITPSRIDFAAVETTVARAIRRRSTTELNLLGHGEVSLVLAWPTANAVAAVKRVPPFSNRSRAEAYVVACHKFFDTLRAADVSIWPTDLHVLQRADGRAVVYHQQPIADPAQLGSNVLRATPGAQSHPLLEAVVEATQRVCQPTVGFDCQLANWLWDGTTAHHIDFTSPFLLTASRTDLVYDSKAFLQEYPVILRPYLKRELTKLINRFTTAEGALTDMVANMIKEGVDHWIEPALATINSRLGTDLQRATAHDMLNADRNLLPMILKVKKAQRWWITRTGRQYEQLLPDRTTYDR